MQELAYPIFYPSHWEMISIDVAIILVAAVATGVLLAKRSTLRRANAFTGLALIAIGLWVLSLLNLLDLFALFAAPGLTGEDAAMRLLQDIHTGYSWYINALAVLVMFGGVSFTVVSVVRQTDAIEESRRRQRESEDVLQSIFDNIPVGIVIKDRRHRIETANRTYLDWYGLEQRDLIGKPTNRRASFKFEADVRTAQAHEVETLKTGAITTHENTRSFANGELHYLKVTKFPVFDRNGVIVKVGSVSIDLTEMLTAQRKAELALHEARAATEARSRFLATMSHEFRTPLNAIIGYSDILMQQLFGPIGSARYQTYAKDINDSGRHMLELINDVLDISSIEAGKRTLEIGEVDLAEVLEECRRLLKPQIAATTVTTDFADLRDLPPLSADRRAVKQIFLNVLSNAVKFNRANGTVKVSAECQEDFVEVRIADSGQGIAADLIDTIAEPFTRGGIDPLVAQPGTGLGLSIVSSLIEMHHGRLRLESEVDVGTTVIITLPAITEAARRAAPQQTAG